MTELFMRLLGAPVDHAERIAGASLAFRGGLGMGWFVFLLLAFAAFAVWTYRSAAPAVAPWKRHALAVLRIAFLALLLGLLLRPVLAFTVEGSIRRALAVLIDGSASMQIKDPRLDERDRKRAAIAMDALDPKAGLGQSLRADRAAAFLQMARVDLVKGALQNPRLDLLPRLDQEFDLSAFSFGQGLAELSRGRTNAAAQEGKGRRRANLSSFDWVETIEAKSTSTALGDAVRDILQRKRGQPLAGIVLITDGVNNAGIHPRDAAAQARAEGVPLYIHGVGITSPRDIILQNLFAPDVSFVKDEVAVTVRVRAQGLAGESAELTLKLDEEIVVTRTVQFGADDEQVVPLKFAPQRTGDFTLTASVTPRADETVQDNNTRAHRLKVINARIKVLLVDQTPRWEFKYLQMMLLRDRRVDLKCVLVEGDRNLSRTPDSPYLPEFPARRDDLFQYDLVILGDIDPKALSPQLQENLNKLVSEFGGALVVLAGKRFMPASYRRSALDKLLPVEFDGPTLDTRADLVADKPIKLQLTAAGRASAMLRLSDKETENAQLWSELPPIYWAARVTRAKPAAEVLLVDPDPAKESRSGKMPVMAAQQYGLGQVLYVGTDNFWRWRKNAGDFFHTAIWGQISQRVSIQRLLGVSRRTQLSTDRQTYMTGDRVSVYARLYSGAGFDPVEQPAIKGTFAVKSGQGSRGEVSLRPVPEQPAMYRGEFIAPAAGNYGFSVENDPETVIDFNVAEPKFEFGETAMSEPLLKEIARSTGGEFFREETLHALPDTIRSKTERVQSPLEVELWSSPLYFLLLIGVVTAEWVVRKLCYLK